jgi:UDP-N-acetylmuramate dehydrogenase
LSEIGKVIAPNVCEVFVMCFEIQQNVSLAEYTTFNVGGNARYFVEARDESEVSRAIEFAEKNALEIFILGGGSNVLIADEGFDGLVIKVALKGVARSAGSSETVFVNAGAGEDWDNLVAFCVGEDLQGFECLSGIPGLVGGTPIQNVGAYGQEVSETIVSVRVYDRKTKKSSELNNAECEFAYRRSIFNTIEKNRYIVLAVTYKLKSNGEPKIAYRDLQNFFGEKQPTLQETREAVLEIRRAKSMVIDENDVNSQSAGSFFKNPIVSLEEFAEFEKIAQILKIGNVPHFKVDEKFVKIPAAWLIEKADFHKGFIRGKVGISTKHTLAIINRGNATAQEILDFKCEIQSKVKDRFHLELKPEPVFIGFEKINENC